MILFEKISKRKIIQKILSKLHFLEIAPLDYEIDECPQKDLSSIPISEIRFS